MTWVDFYKRPRTRETIFGFSIVDIGNAVFIRNDFVVLFFLREIFTANAASPPVDTELATINPTVVKQNGHILHLSGGEASSLGRLYMGDGSGGAISTGRQEKIGPAF